jgi:Polyketide cyclase / dehydrase and lipid transport
MRYFDVQSIGIEATAKHVFEFIAEPANLPRWTSAFHRADENSAEMLTPQGAVSIKLAVMADRATGTIDWKMTFPDGAVGMAYSRVTPDGDARSVYSFVLMAPPVPLEALEGALEAQRATLAQELPRLKGIVEGA